MRKGLTLIEILIALLVVGLIVGFAVSILRDENSNMIHVRSRVQSQTAARDGLKIMESELRATGFGIGISYKDAANQTLEISSISGCATLLDATTQSSIVAMDGKDGGPDTLDLAFPAAVNGSTGAACGSAQWSRYLLIGSDLVRYGAASRLALANATPTIVGRNVDVFQVQLTAVGISKPGKYLLQADSCCWTTGAATWTPTGATTVVDAVNRTDTLSVTGTWRFLSRPRDLSAGETWRASVTIEQANGALISDLTTNPTTSFVKMGLYNSTTNAEVATVALLSRPTVASAMFGTASDADLVVPAKGTYRLGISGKTAAVGGKIVIRSFDALSVRLGADSTWLKNPSDMNPDDWTRIKGVRVQILTRAPADKKDFHTKFTGLANFRQTTTSVPGEFDVKDTSVRVLLDHQYPAGNNGKF